MLEGTRSLGVNWVLSVIAMVFVVVVIIREIDYERLGMGISLVAVIMVLSSAVIYNCGILVRVAGVLVVVLYVALVSKVNGNSILPFKAVMNGAICVTGIVVEHL